MSLILDATERRCNHRVRESARLANVWRRADPAQLLLGFRFTPARRKRRVRAASKMDRRESMVVDAGARTRERNTLMNVSNTKRIVLGLAGLALAATFLAARGQEQRPRTRAEIMRMKLEYSKKVLEGLTLENYETIIKNAQALKKLSEAAEWEVPTIPNAGEYVVFTSEFQRLADELAKKAKEKNMDGATLAYLRLTMNCVNCHKYVRQATK